MKHISDPKAANVNIPAQTPSGRMYPVGYQHNILKNTETLILLDTIDPLFTDGIEDVVNHWIKPAVAGYYLFSASATWEVGIDAKHYKLLVYAGPIPKVIAIDHKGFSGAGGGCTVLTCHCSDITKLIATQYIYMTVEHFDGTNNPDIMPGPVQTYLSVQRVR